MDRKGISFKAALLDFYKFYALSIALVKDTKCADLVHQKITLNQKYSSVICIQGLKSLIVHSFCFLRTTPERGENGEEKECCTIANLCLFIITEIAQR